MATDLFQNYSNDYINPNLATCPGTADTNTFGFLTNQQVGILEGSSIISAMSLGDISQEVEGWVQQTKILESGEVVFIQGLTKGISSRTQVFLFDGSVAYTGDDDHPYYMSADISINYYRNFRYYDNGFHVTGDYTGGIDIASAFNTKLGDLGISVTCGYDASGLTFTGSTAGYTFNVTALDVSLWLPDTSIWGKSITEDLSSGLPAYKYPNTAMLGYVLKVTYPSTAVDYQSYIEVNHAPDYLTYYEVSTGNPNAYVRYYKAVDVGMSGTGTSATLSAADYLDYVETNGKWEKVGVLKAWLAAVDQDDSNEENLITGFYVYNPQSFAVKIDYMTIL
jgi:hypothetical protein